MARREVQPQLGLLKSTMLQLDSSFTERDYGASSFRQFVEMLARERLVEINRVSGHYLVEIPRPEEVAKVEESLPNREDALPALHKALRVIDENDLWGQLDSDAVKEYVQRVDSDFDEKRYGFGQFAELLNFAQDLELVRLEPDAESVLRVYPGLQFTPARHPVTAFHPAAPAAPAPAAALAPSTPLSEEPLSEERSAFAALPPEEVPEAPAAEAAAADEVPTVTTDVPPAPKPKRTYNRRSYQRPRSPRGPRKPTPGKT